MGERVLHKIQYGLETNHGQAADADTMLLGEVSLPEADRDVIIPGFGTGERIPGQLASAFVRRVLAEGVTFQTPADRGGLYYQLLPLLFSTCIVGNQSPTAQTSGQSDFLWTFDTPLSAAETLESFTLECGDNSRAYEIAYCMAPELQFSGNCDSGEVTVSARIFGDKITPTTFTGAFTAPTATFVVGKLARIYVASAWASLGTGELVEALVDWTLTIRGGAHPKLRGSAQRVLDAHGQGEFEVTLNLGLERSVAEVVTEEDYFLAETVTPRFVRVEIDSGIAIGSGQNHKLTFDLAGAWVGWQSFGRDQDGNTLDVATLRVGKDSEEGKAFTAKVITDVSSI